jgi:hypothetical protein
MNFQAKFYAAQESVDERKRVLMVRRLMDVQRRAKIKPSAMNPILLNSSRPSQQNVQVNSTPTE